MSNFTSSILIGLIVWPVNIEIAYQTSVPAKQFTRLKEEPPHII